MMNIRAECDRRGIRLEADGAVLNVDAPKGALSPDLVEALKEHKAELLAALTQPANPETPLTKACQGVEGIDAATFWALLSPADVEDIAGGDAKRLCTELCRGHTRRKDQGACCSWRRVVSKLNPSRKRL